MKLKSPGDNNRISPQYIATVLGVGAVILIILLIVIIPNLDSVTGKKNADNSSDINQTEAVTGNDSPVIAETRPDNNSVNSPDDLDFWDLYPEETTTPVQDDSNNQQNADSDNADDEDPSTDGKHTEVTLRDGTVEWVVISQYLPKNDYDYTNLVLKNDEMQYYADGRQCSYFGIDVNKYQDYIDFVRVKKAGVDFVMIRVGSRGYGTGQISMDDYFYDNIKRAFDAGLQVGVYFSSQAVTKDEAIEEANTVIEALDGYEITYPIVFDMEFIDNDSSRIEVLSREGKTDITKAFLDTVKAAGYTGMIYGNKEWLIKEIDMSKLTDYDVWLAQVRDLPDYPYKFSMWQYKTNGSIDGISGYVNLNISFVDYSEK